MTTLETTIDFSEHTYEPSKPTFAIWHTGNGPVPITIIAFSLGATKAFCIIGLGRNKLLESGNYGTAWLAVRDLEQF